MEEFDLSEYCRRGDSAARKQLYERYSGRLFGICLRYATDRDQAQDILHDGFIKIYGSFDKFSWRGEGSLRAWMERVMINTALQILRKNSVMNRVVELDEARELVERPEDDETESIPHKVLLEFINELPTGYRTVFNLYVFEEKPHKEIARLLGINEKSSASQFYRAKVTLAKKIKEYSKKTFV